MIYRKMIAFDDARIFQLLRTNVDGAARYKKLFGNICIWLLGIAHQNGQNLAVEIVYVL